MVDIGAKATTHRRAVATSTVLLSREAFDCLNDGRVQKGDVLATARVAGIMAAKRTSDLIPLCHQIPISQIEVPIELNPAQLRATIFAEVTTTAQTGVEMEAMVAASTTALTIYDMLKAVDRAITITQVELIEKQGGKSGDYRRPPRVQRRGPNLGDETSVPQPASAEAMVESAENGGRAQARSEPRVSTPEIKFSKKSLKRAKQLVTLESSDENLEQLLSKTPIKSAYMLGDLDPAYAHGCTWLALDETPLDSVLLLYSALRVPTLLSEGDADTIEAIILGACINPKTSVFPNV